MYIHKSVKYNGIFKCFLSSCALDFIFLMTSWSDVTSRGL